jgi:sulfur-oxidizing protein SoxY
MFSAKRRQFFQRSISGWVALLSALFSLNNAYATWSPLDFSPDAYNDILKQLFKDRMIMDSELLKISLPQTAENGSVVPITISSELENIQRLYILVEKNPTPLAVEFSLGATLAVYVTTRIKMAESCHVVVIAEQGDRLLSSRQWVNVVLGGCGSG